MADTTKHHATINGGSLLSELKSLFSILRTKRTITFAYGFMLAFLAFTIFLAFNASSNSSSPWFNNLFTTSLNSTTSSKTTTIFAGDSYRSHFSSIFSHFFPNTSQQTHKISPLQSPISTTRSKNATNQPPILNKESPNSQNHIQTAQAVKPTKSPKSPVSANQSANSVPKVQTQSQNKGLNDKVKKNATEVPKVQSQSQNKGLKDKVKKNSAGNEEKRVREKGVVANLTSSLLKKQSNKTNAAVVSAKRRSENFVESLMNCNLFDGEWVRDDSYPLYKPGSCSLIDEQFNCFLNGRPDNGYHQLKWKPKGCNLPRLNGRHMLELLRGKRLVFVGDSLNRNMWESLICILRNSVKDKSKVYEASGRHHFRTEASYSFVFKDYDCTVEFFVSPFIVQEWEMVDKNGLKKETLRLDVIGRSADEYKSADILIFNTGHWWTHEKTSKGKDYYQEGSHVYSELNVVEAFRRALTTWGRWVDAHVNPKKTLVFFRGYSASHFSGGQWNSGGQCDHETEPIKNKSYLSQYPRKMKALESVLKGMKTKVSYMNITRMTDYRKDGHPSIYRKQNLTEEERRSPLKFQDCSHWCLPGVPDSWNELLYAELLRRKHNPKQ